MEQEVLTISKVALRAGVVTANIRFYERKGLILAPARSEGGYRLYTTDTVDRVRFIRRAKGLGFSLLDIQELLNLSDKSVSC